MAAKHTDVHRATPVKLSRSKFSAPEPVVPFISDTARISTLAELMAKVEMLRNDIMPCEPATDIGTDIVTQHRHILKRVQIKGQATDGKSPHTFTFSTRRNELNGKRAYEPDELDAFVFVHTECRRFFIVPARKIVESGRYTITFGPNSHNKWENAWWVLKRN